MISITTPIEVTQLGHEIYRQDSIGLHAQNGGSKLNEVD